MLWVPGLSLVVFFLVMIAFTLYGFKKGWVYALCFSITLWLVTLVFVGINYALYKYLWKAFSSLILDANKKVNIDLDNLSSFYKLQIILFATGIETILIYPITFLLMLLINRFTEHYLGHKVKEISINEKEIVYKRKITRSRVIGSSILVISTLFSASLVSSSLNTIFTPYKKTNFANEINDFLGNVYSLGLTKNTESSQIISNFISKKLDTKLAEEMRQLTSFYSNETKGKNVFPNLEELGKLSQRKNDFEDLFKNEKATLGVFSSVVRSKPKSINPLSYSEETATEGRDSKGNIIGYEKSSSGGDPIGNIEFFKSFLKKNKINLELKDSLIKFLVQRIQENFLPFKETIFYIQFLQANWTLAQYENSLGERRQMKQVLEDNIIILIENRKKIISELDKVLGQSGVQSGDPNKENAIVYGPKTIGWGAISSLPENSSLKKEAKEEDKTKKRLDEKTKEKEQANLEYQNYNNNTYRPLLARKNNLEQSYKLSNDTLNNLKQSLESQIKRISNLENELNREKRSLAIIEPAIVNLEQKKDKEKYLKEIEDRIANIERDLANVKREKENIETLINSEKLKVNRLKTELDSSKTNYNIALKEYERLRKKRDKKQEEYENAKNINRDQILVVQNIILKYNKDILGISTINQRIKDDREKINIFSNRNASAFAFSGQAKRDMFPERDDVKDDGSIYFYEQAIDFIKDRIGQKEEIKYKKEIEYNELKDQIIKSYTKWLRGS